MLFWWSRGFGAGNDQFDQVGGVSPHQAELGSGDCNQGELVIPSPFTPVGSAFLGGTRPSEVIT